MGESKNEKRASRKRKRVSIPYLINSASQDCYMPMNQASEYLGIPTKTMKRHLDEIPHYSPFGRPLFKKSELDMWMKRFRNDQDVDLDVLGKMAMKAVQHLKGDDVA